MRQGLNCPSLGSNKASSTSSKTFSETDTLRSSCTKTKLTLQRSTARTAPAFHSFHHLQFHFVCVESLNPVDFNLISSYQVYPSTLLLHGRGSSARRPTTTSSDSKTGQIITTNTDKNSEIRKCRVRKSEHQKETIHIYLYSIFFDIYLFLPHWRLFPTLQ